MILTQSQEHSNEVLWLGEQNASCPSRAQSLNRGLPKVLLSLVPHPPVAAQPSQNQPNDVPRKGEREATFQNSGFRGHLPGCYRRPQWNTRTCLKVGANQRQGSKALEKCPGIVNKPWKAATYWELEIYKQEWQLSQQAHMVDKEAEI